MNGVSLEYIAFKLPINKITVLGICESVREAKCYHVANNSNRIRGYNPDGTAMIAEVDESLFFLRKYNHGWIMNSQWYVGGIERQAWRSFMLPVENKNDQTMARVKAERVEIGTRMITAK